MQTLAIFFIVLYPIWWGIATELGRASVRWTIWRYSSIWARHENYPKGK